MNKLLTTIGAAAILGCGGFMGWTVQGWVSRINVDHETVSRVNLVTINDDHETLRQLWWKDQYINGAVTAAPVAAPKPAAPVAAK